MLKCSSLDLRWRGDAYRVTSVERANEADLTSGEGSRIWGGRWNPQGSFRTVYLSLHYATAMEEYLAGNRRNGLPDSEAMPSVTIGVRLDLARVLDLTHGEMRKIFKVSLKRMVTEPHGIGTVESLTQAIGRLAWSECYEGVLVPSTAWPSEKNIVVFPGKLCSGQLVPLHAGRLPPRTS
jgi:RES domain-containing protein